MSIFLCVSMSSRPHQFLEIIRAACNCAHCMRMQAIGSNSLSGSIICLSIRTPGRPQDFCNFCICINIQCGGPAPRYIYPRTGFLRTQVGSSRAYMSIRPSICISFALSLYPVVHVTFWKSFARPVIACSTFSRRSRGQIP